MSFINRLVIPALLVASAIGMGPTIGFAQSMPSAGQSEEDHNAHHPGASAQKPSVAQPMEGMPMGMMRQNGQAGMMTMMSSASSMMSSHVEGRIASLKAGLAITEAQTPQWNRFADTLRATAKSMNGMYGQMMQPKDSVTLPARLEAQETMLASHLAALKALKDALDPLYASFSGDQKKRADELMIGPMGIM
jgi:hypothetical protein